MKNIIIAGPCQHESYHQSYEIAAECKRVCEQYGFDYVFKASYDKANRSAAGSKRGVGMNYTMLDFQQLKQDLGVRTLTDVHSEAQIAKISQEFKGAVDIVQIPAFLCRQTDMLQTAAKYFDTVNVKKGQFLAPWDMKGILSKVEGYDCDVWITERGTSFGYNTLVVDFTGLQYLLDNFAQTRVILDATHSVQKPGGNGTTSGGNREYVPRLSYAAAATGVQSFFFEVHPDPDNAPSDGPNSLRLEDFEKVISKLRKIIDASE